MSPSDSAYTHKSFKLLSLVSTLLHSQPTEWVAPPPKTPKALKALKAPTPHAPLPAEPASLPITPYEECSAAESELIFCGF